MEAEFLKRNNASRSLSCTRYQRNALLKRAGNRSPYGFGFDFFQMIRGLENVVVVDVHVVFTFAQQNC